MDAAGLESVVLEEWFHAPPVAVFRAWLDSKAHTAFTGGAAVIDPNPGGEFSAWDGYIQGRTVALEPPRRIVQSWRTSEFLPEDSDSRLMIELHAERGGTRFVLHHSDIPPGQGVSYAQGWIDHYFEPMKRYFEAAA